MSRPPFLQPSPSSTPLRSCSSPAASHAHREFRNRLLGAEPVKTIVEPNLHCLRLRRKVTRCSNLSRRCDHCGDSWRITRDEGRCLMVLAAKIGVEILDLGREVRRDHCLDTTACAPA